MDAGDGHAWTSFARVWLLRVIRSVRLGVVVAGEALAPDGRAFLGVHRSPAARQLTRRDEEVTARLRFKRFARGPNVISKRRVLQQIPVALLPHQRRVVADLPMHDGGDDECVPHPVPLPIGWGEGVRRTGEGFPKRHLIIQPNFLREFGHLRQRETLLRRSGVANLLVQRRLRVERTLDALQRERSTTEGNLRFVLHVPKAFPRAGDSFRRRAHEAPGPHGFPERLQFRHPPQPRIYVSQFAHRTVGDGFALSVGRILRQRPCLFPRVQRQRVMSGVVVFQAQAGEQRRPPRRLGMFLQETREAGEIIRPAALRVAQQRSSQRSVLVRSRFAPNRHERLFEDARAENLLDRRLRRKLQPRFWRGHFGECTVGTGFPAFPFGQSCTARLALSLRHVGSG